jgi:hypothetical protein
MALLDCSRCVTGILETARAACVAIAASDHKKEKSRNASDQF